MVKNLNTKIGFILAVIILAIYVLLAKDITLGLDLSGGSSLRYKLPKPEDPKADMSEVVKDTIEVFRKRIDSIGLKEIPIRQQGADQILVELPGMAKNEVENIIQIIQSQGNLDWLLAAETEHDADNPDIYIDVDEEAKKLVDFLKEKEKTAGGWDLNTDLTPLDKELKINGKEARFRWFPMAEATLEKQGRPILSKGSTFDSIRKMKGWQNATDEQIAKSYFMLLKIFKDPKWRFGGKDLVSVRPSFDRSRMPAVGFEFNPSRASDFGEFTKAHIKKRLAIVLDGKVSTDPVIQSELPGEGIISGPAPKGFLPDEQKALLTVLRSGSITVKPILLSRHDIGPTLGENSIYRGKLAALIGLVMVFVFIVSYYFLAGVVASISLIINLLLLMGVLVFLEATLTLPGIAGIVLTVGMAVDANILIFERIREEKDKGKTLAQSVKNGFERAFVTIVDANVTTFITAAILFYYGTGPIKGFGIILMYGIITSLFSALVVSKVIFAILLNKGLKTLHMLRILRNAHVDFLGLRRIFTTISLSLIIVGLILFFAEDQSKYGLDFTGGYNVHLVCRKGVTQAEVQRDLGARFNNVQVISVKGVGVENAERPRDTEIFNVKIKSTSLERPGEEVAAAGQDTGAGTARAGFGVQPEKAAGAAETGGEKGNDPLSTADLSKAFLQKIREIMGDRILADPISGVKLTPHGDKETTTVEATLHFITPPAAADQIKGLDRAGREKVFRKNVEDTLGDLLDVEKVSFADNDLSIHIRGEYKRSANILPDWLKASILNRFKQAAERGIPVTLSDPFPMTDYIGPTVGTELRDKAIISILFSLLAIIIYIRLRFKEYKYGFAACIALVHDVLITLGSVALIRMVGLVEIEIDLPIIAAFLTIIGYSLNDTIVVFDRIRENLPRINRPYGEVINMSINQTLSRTILTSLTTFMVVVILFVVNYGQRNVLEGFSFAMIVGVVVGTYSSIFVASPILFILHSRELAKAADKK